MRRSERAVRTPWRQERRQRYAQERRHLSSAMRHRWGRALTRVFTSLARVCTSVRVERAPRGFAQAAEGTGHPQKSFTFRPQLATGRWCGALALPWAWPWADGGAPGGARAELGSESGYRFTF